jgi:hypothetical protein
MDGGGKVGNASEETMKSVLGPSIQTPSPRGGGWRRKVGGASDGDNKVNTWPWTPFHPDQQSPPGIYILWSVAMNEGEKAGGVRDGDKEVKRL